MFRKVVCSGAALSHVSISCLSQSPSPQNVSNESNYFNSNESLPSYNGNLAIMKLAKNHMDVGFQTDDYPASEKFWKEAAGIEYQELLTIPGTPVRQHRYGVHGSVVKVNDSSERLEESATVYRGLRIASDKVSKETPLNHPDGIPVSLVPPGFEDIHGIEITVATSDPAKAKLFWGDGLGGTELTNGRFRVGDTVIRTVLEPDLTPMDQRQGKGFRYLTVQVFNVDEEHARITGLGFKEGLAPVTLGTVARIAFVRDADGGWVEISQRGNLTGPLPPNK